MTPKKPGSGGGRASSRRWLARRDRDPYVRMAAVEDFRTRAAYKIRQLDERDRLFRPGDAVVDLGAAPGGFSQYIARRLGFHPPVVAVDRLQMAPMRGVRTVCGDLLDPSTVEEILALCAPRGVDVVVSDMAPSLSGVRDRDQARHRELVEAALQFARRALKADGGMVVKLFEGAERGALTGRFKDSFREVSLRKPGASRTRSRELYLVAKGYNP